MDFQFLIIAGSVFVISLVFLAVNGSVRDALESLWGSLETESVRKFLFFSFALLILVIFAGSVAKQGLTIKDILFLDTAETIE